MSDFHSIQSSSHRSLRQPSPSASKSLERQQQVQQEGSGQPTQTHRNLKTLPSNMHRVHRVPELAVLRPHVNQDTAKDMQADRMQAHWSDPLASEGYGRRPTPRPTPDLEGIQQTGHATQGTEPSDLLPPVEQASVGTQQGSSLPDPHTRSRHPSDHGASPEEVASPHLEQQTSISANSSDYHSILGEVKKENIESLPKRYTDAGIVEEILELTNKHDILSEKVDGIVEENQELLEEVQSMSENISTLMENMRLRATQSDSLFQEKKKPNQPKRRTEEALVLAASVRDYLAVLLRVKDVGLVSVSAEDASRFAKLCNTDEKGGDCCTMDNFRVDLIGTC
ncbi:hypothetical protein BDN71DRAFT_1514342 [Pleurotus eryngii]|uniref:Uncharacterized protein n=1 Tax=Pleurotus eryngii TaxID=5323 RepID=A0A9P6D009_PLEER|nr:hypothetical protein BDN71DRAFT_1514342 [Pleurotus eryngii]